jgi:hypothetical protein
MLLDFMSAEVASMEERACAALHWTLVGFQQSVFDSSPFKLFLPPMLHYFMGAEIAHLVESTVAAIHQTLEGFIRRIL